VTGQEKNASPAGQRLSDVLGPVAPNPTEQPLSGAEEEPAALERGHPEVLEALACDPGPVGRRQCLAIDEGQVVQRDATPARQDPVREPPQAGPEPLRDPERETSRQAAN
jgi:hypothetical protein